MAPARSGGGVKYVKRRSPDAALHRPASGWKALHWKGGTRPGARWLRGMPAASLQWRETVAGERPRLRGAVRHRRAAAAAIDVPGLRGRPARPRGQRAAASPPGLRGTAGTGPAGKAAPCCAPLLDTTRGLGPGGDNGWTGRVGCGRAEMCLRTRPGLRPAMNGPGPKPGAQNDRGGAAAAAAASSDGAPRALRDASSVTQRQLPGEAAPSSVRRRPEPCSVPGPRARRGWPARVGSLLVSRVATRAGGASGR